ncbi:FkbM family methyltransferase [Lichenihabitans psoromatis]|uniref:FkbM family methyltransferase n=1 Tax=Lichenihabitans psoromatis TaxID=2528642 RepID=UPI0010359499|nr:FkbM family methyltransferase [Lichenihabitans psoromatis]
MINLDEPFLILDEESGVSFFFRNADQLDTIATQISRDGLGSYEFPTPAIIIYLAREAGGLFLDVGANTGLLSLVAAAANPLIRVVAFEPLESVRLLLGANVAANPTLAPRITIESIGLSNKAGTSCFYETINDVGLVTTSSSLELSHAESIGVYHEQTIETETLDRWSERLSSLPIRLIKIDVEGHEYAVLEGGQKTIAKNRPYLTIEVLGNAGLESINRFLIEADYIDFAIAPSGLRHCASVAHHFDAWNHLLCPSEKAAQVLRMVRHLGIDMSLV